MATGFSQEGDNPTYTAPATVTAGTCVKVGDELIYPIISVASGAQFTGVYRGIITHAKLSAQAWTEGQAVNWDDTNKRFTTVTTGNFRAGTAYRVAANPSAQGQVKLHGVGLGTALA
jgi:predicted RecA/RadA family phage recombinase